MEEPMDYDLFYEPETAPKAQKPGLVPSREIRNGRIGTSVCFWVCGCGFATWVSRIPLVKQQLHLSDQQLGIALLALGLGALIGFPLSGAGCARFGSKPVTVLLTLGFCVMLALIPFATNLVSLMALLGVFGVVHGGMDVAMNANGVEVESRYGRSIMSSLHGMFSLSGAIFGLALVGLGVSEQVHLAGAAAVFVLSTLWAWTLMFGEQPTGHMDHPIFALPSRPLLAIGVIVTCSFLCEGAMADWSGVYLRESLKTTAQFAVEGFVAFALMMTAARFVGDLVLNRWGPVRVLRVSGSIAAVGFATALLVGQPYIALVGFGCVGLGMSTVAPIGFSAAGRTEGMPSGSAIAAVGSMGYGGFLIGPPFIGLVAQHMSLRLALGIVVVLAVVIVLLAGTVRSGTARSDNLEPHRASE
jgi:MFS family permease